MVTSALKLYRPRAQTRVKARIRTGRLGIGRSTIRIPISDDARLESLTYRNGQVYDSYLACEPDRQRFWSSDQSGVVTYMNVAGHLKVGGGLLAKDEDKPRLLAEFLEFVSKNYRSAVFFNITDADLPLFERHGIQVTKWGEDALIDLATWNCQGKAFEWLRRQKNFCTRHGVQCTEWHPGLCDKDEYLAIREELQFVAEDSLESKAQIGETKFFEGRLNFDQLGNKRIFIGRSENGQGRIEAFVVANPYCNGTRWAFEMYRHRQDAIRGVVPHLKLAVIDLLKAEGCQEVSLCLIPGLNCQSSRTGDNSFVRRILSLGTKYLNSIFDSAGIYHYKSRYRPRLENRYVCAYPRSTLATVLTSAYLMGFFQVSVTKLAGRLWNQWTTRNRTSLAKPHETTACGQAAQLQATAHH